MRLIDELTAEARQQYNIVGEDGEEIELLLWYAPTQQSWYFNVTNEDFTLQGAQLTYSPNILRSYRNLLSFGFGVTVTDGLDPFYLDDFISGRVQLYLLNRSDVAEIETRLFD